MFGAWLSVLRFYCKWNVWFIYHEYIPTKYTTTGIFEGESIKVSIILFNLPNSTKSKLLNCFFFCCLLFFNKMFIKSRLSLSIALSIRRVDRTGRTVSLRPAAAPASLPPLAACYFPARWLSSPRAESSLSAFLNGAPTPPHTYQSE